MANQESMKQSMEPESSRTVMFLVLSILIFR